LAGYRNVGYPGSTWQGTLPNTGLTNVPAQFQPYFGGADEGMDPNYAATYLAHAFGGTAQVQSLSMAGVIAELANGPLIMNVNERNKQGTPWGGHYFVITGYDPATLTFTVNDPFPPFAAYYGNSPANEKVSLSTIASWYQGRVLVFRPDTSLSTNGRRYTAFVDNGVNNDGLTPYCTMSTNCFTVDALSGKASTGQYAWQLRHSVGLDYAYPIEARHSARWKPFLPASGYYEVVIRTYAAANSGATRYALHDANGQELTARYVDQNNTSVAERVASLGTVFLSNGAYVDAAMAPNAPADVIAFLDREYPSVASRPQPTFSFTANGKSYANSQSVALFTNKGTPLTVALNAAASQAGPAATITSYEWFADGVKIGTGATPTFTLAAGTHMVILQVSNSFGLAAYTSATMVITEATPPTPAFTFSGGGKSGGNNQSVLFSVAHGSTLALTFNAGASQPGYGSLTYIWQNGNSATSTQPSFTTNFGPGTYTITLRLTNTAGLTASTSALISITEIATPPTASFTFSGGGKSGASNQTVQLATPSGTSLPISFNGTTSQAGTGSLTYAWLYNNVSLTTLSTFTANFNPGTYVITLRVTNTAGLTASTSATITITATVPPTAAFTFSGGGKSGTNNQTINYTVARNGSVAITFNAATSKAGSAPIAGYLWQSNGTTISTQSSFTYTFGTPTNNITLRITDSAGQTSTATAVIAVKAQ
jgi:hypothetical protein